MDAGNDEPPVLLDRAARATRGKRITKLLEDEVEQDEAFWNQDALKDEENDDNYVEEQDAGDEFDSDFGEDESEPDDEPEKEERERLPIEKRLMFPGKTLRKTNVKKKKVTPKLEDDAKADKSADKPSSSTQADVPDELEVEKTIRKSTRTSVIMRQAEREAICAEKEATAKARPGLHKDAVGGAAGARKDTDKPERYINAQVFRQTGILIVVRGLANMLLLWSTVVLLGGFVSDLPSIDFGFISSISVLLSIRIFNALVDEQYKYLRDWVMKYSDNATAASGIQWFFSQITVVALLMFYIILVAFPMVVYIFLLGVSLVRLKHYRHKLGDAATASLEEKKMDVACFGFYFINLFQSVLYLVWYILDLVISSWTVKKTVEKCGLNHVSWGKDCVSQYLASTKSKYLSDLNAEWNMVKFASGLLDSKSNTDLLSGARMVNHFLDKKKLPVQELIRSSRSRVEKLLMMLAWKQPADREMRLEAAKIVAHVASDMDIAQFPGTLGCIFSLIDPSGDDFSLYASAETNNYIGVTDRNEDLIQQGFRILDKLTLDHKHNRIQILQDQALLAHIISWVRSKPFIQGVPSEKDTVQEGYWKPNYWEPILKPCLDVLVRLTGLREQNASQLHEIIKFQVPIFISGYANKPELQVKLIQMFANVFYPDYDEKNENPHPKRIEFLKVIWGLFLTCIDNPNQVQEAAGEALSMLSANEINCHALYKLLDAEKLDTIISGRRLSMVYRSLAAEIDARVYTKTIPKDVTSKAKKLDRVVRLLKDAAKNGDNDEPYFFYRLQAALVRTIDVLILTVMVEDEDRQTHKEGNINTVSKEEMERRTRSSKFKQIIIQQSLSEDFVQVIKSLIEKDSNVATAGRLYFVKTTASLIRSMIERGFLAKEIKSAKIIESLENAKKDLSRVDSWEIFESTQRHGLKWKTTLDSLINDIQGLLSPPENTKGKQAVLPSAPLPSSDSGESSKHDGNTD